MPEDTRLRLTSFDRVTAAAVVTVLQRAGIRAWAGATGDADETEVLVAAGDRERALSTLATRMEEVRREVVGGGGGFADTPRPDPDDLYAGPPLVMERFRSLSIAVAIILGPLLVVTLAAPAVPRSARVAIFLVLATVLAAWWFARQR